MSKVVRSTSTPLHPIVCLKSLAARGVLDISHRPAILISSQLLVKEVRAV